ncbi:EscU/YscU/HrcU family type III secretion system export apparatus switch protein [Amylibacter sp. SFDW26]|uniref:EscU/YscU/HrcU family type III secretion system export apparatus switch protein n=1 Tax=Amylibacter sp. SFDW26 TaxID=2652722 RepID=UPI0012627F7E|nr:EscU/YscU/HrcU family type III secretion system export apparatus switch protein [Amylibacter sp. SFDW26]KAB7613600.1 EscU/YscU/HrcU family type III secretion system export apparatus switch protein [Amylibacter sp. SFDW26]
MSDTETKKHAASDQKLQKQRKEGNVPNVAEVSNFVASALSIILLAVLFVYLYKHLSVPFDIITNGLDQPFRIAYPIAIQEIGKQLAIAVGPIVVLTISATILTSIAYNKGIPFAIKPIIPDVKRISPAAGFKRLFGLRTWVEVGVGFIRLVLWIGSSAYIIWLVVEDLVEIDYCGKSCAIDIALSLAIQLLTIAVLFMIVSVVLEMLIQKFLFTKEQKMTDTEVKNEQKEQHGTKEVRQERKRLQHEMADGAEASGVEKANMCFYWGDACLAVRYHPEYADIPRISAKSKNPEKTLKIRKQISENGFKELEHQGIVEAAFSTEAGGVIHQSAHKELLDALTALFGQNT